MADELMVRAGDGAWLFTQSVGQGTPVVLCDGIGCDGFIWRYLRPQLAAHHRVIHWHYRGHGRSGAPPSLASLTIPAFARDLLAVLDAYGIDRAVLAGHSLGVQVVLDFALVCPTRVAALVPICGSYGRLLDHIHGDSGVGRAFPALRESVMRFGQRAQQMWQKLFASKVAYALASRFEVNGRVVRAADFQPYFDHMARMDAKVFVTLLDQVQHYTLEDQLPAIAAPTMVIAGERDTLTPVWLSERMRELIPGAELLVVPGGSHVAPIEIPELIYLRLERFLAERVALPPGPPVAGDGVR